MGLSQYAPKGVKSLCITSSQTVYVRKPDLVLCKTQERLGGRPICEIYLNTYFQRARLGGRLICEIGLYASIYGIISYQFYGIELSLDFILLIICLSRLKPAIHFCVFSVHVMCIAYAQNSKRSKFAETPSTHPCARAAILESF